MKFTEEIDTYVVLKLALADYRGNARPLGPEYCIAGGEVRNRVRRMERRLLQRDFVSWAAPYCGKIEGWRDDSPVYALHGERLVGGVYLCERNEYGEDAWGQVHYAFMDPEYRGRGIYSVLFAETVRRAREWRLEGLFLNSDRHALPEVYERWGAVPFEKRTKASHRTLGVIRKALRKIQNAARIAENDFREGLLPK